MSEKEQDKQAEEKESRDLYEWVQALVCSVLVVVLVFTFCIRLIGVDGHSMVPTLQDGDRLLVTTSLLSGEYKYGDIVIIQKGAFAGGEPIVKRVIATGGQTVDIDYESNSVYVDGVLLDEPYIREPMDDITADPNRAQTHFEVPEGEIFVMGDNRNNSDDSRDIRIGSIDEDYILGKAVFSLLPFDTIGPL